MPSSSSLSVGSFESGLKESPRADTTLADSSIIGVTGSVGMPVGPTGMPVETIGVNTDVMVTEWLVGITAGADVRTIVTPPDVLMTFGVAMTSLVDVITLVTTIGAALTIGAGVAVGAETEIHAEVDAPVLGDVATLKVGADVAAHAETTVHVGAAGSTQFS